MIFDSLKDKFQLRFKNREFAANILAGALEDSLKKIKVDKNKENSENLIVMGIPRGGVVVADIVSSKLKLSSYQCDFDIIIPRKLTAPGNQEIAIGAIMMEEEGGEKDDTAYLNDDLIKELEISQKYIEKEKTRQIEEIKRRNSLYRNFKKESNIHDRIVIVVDDGAATGATLIASARGIKKEKPKKLIIAIPVSTKDTIGYDEAGKFFIREMELKRKYREAKPSTSSSTDYNIKKNNIFRRNISLTGIYYNLSRYGEDLLRPTIAGIVIVLLATFFFVCPSNPSLAPTFSSNSISVKTNNNSSHTFNITKSPRNVADASAASSSSFIGLAQVGNVTHWLKAGEKSLADFLPLLPLGGDIKVGLTDYLIKIVSGAVTFGLIAIALRRRFERKYYH
jgi:putative phosphoribosyl transferase